MEPEASRAAIVAIAALQKRVRDLEDEAAVLEDDHEVLLAKMNERDQAFAIRENALNEATEKAKQMLSSASTALIQVREARNERDRLNQQIEETEKLIQAQNKKISTQKAQIKKVKYEVGLLMQTLSEYELLLGVILAPPPQTSNLTQEEIAVISSGENDPNILPPILADVLRRLQRMPKKFTKQTLEMKRATVRALFDAKSVTTDLNNKIMMLEKKKFSSSAPRRYEVKIKKLAIQMRIISSEMQKFDFSQ